MSPNNAFLGRRSPRDASGSIDEVEIVESEWVTRRRPIKLYPEVLANIERRGKERDSPREHGEHFCPCKTLDADQPPEAEREEAYMRQNTSQISKGPVGREKKRKGRTRTAHPGENRRAPHGRQPQGCVHAPVRREPGETEHGRQRRRLPRRQLVRPFHVRGGA
jgi:hypothetical protein